MIHSMNDEATNRKEKQNVIKELQMIGGVWCAVVRRESNRKILAAHDFDSQSEAAAWLAGWQFE